MEWFAKNVAFVFAKGCIYTTHDIALMNNIKKVFEHNTTGFLLNDVIYSEYTDADVQTMEKGLFISPGNYHICLFVVVKGDASLSEACSPEYARKGAIDAHVGWKNINDYFIDCVSRYGYKDDVQQPYPEKRKLMTDEIEYDPDMMQKYVSTRTDIENYAANGAQHIDGVRLNARSKRERKSGESRGTKTKPYHESYSTAIRKNQYKLITDLHIPFESMPRLEQITLIPPTPEFDDDVRPDIDHLNFAAARMQTK